MKAPTMFMSLAGNASRTKPAKFLVFLIRTRALPVLVPAE